jgi:hypothetical protein
LSASVPSIASIKVHHQSTTTNLTTPTSHEPRNLNFINRRSITNMEEERLWKFRRPEWLNTVWARNAGVYGAGAIVRSVPRKVAVQLSNMASASCYRYTVMRDSMRQLLMILDPY